MSEKSPSEVLKETLFKDTKNPALTLDDQITREADEFSAGYMDMLKTAKTERLFAAAAIEKAKAAGFSEYVPDKKYNPGDRVYVSNRGKAVIFAVFGKEPLESGVQISAAHIDSPRLDLKPNPLYENGELAYFKTHYYGGIKKYQWPTIPLSLHGVIIKADGTPVTVAVGDAPGDPKLVITDLLPHLATSQYKRPAGELIKGEELNVLIGSRPFKDDKGSELVKLNILKILNEKYGIKEDDFQSAELELVPSFDPCDIGFDRSMIGAYGHDDRVCAYPALMAAIGCKIPTKTTVTILADKEEVGSDGNTGLASSFFKYFIEDIARTEGTAAYRVLRRSRCLSADVSSAFDPNFPEPYEKQNSGVLGRGAVVAKYTGSRGKSGTSDASAEFTGYIRNLLNESGVLWQTGELGKVDAGGGGTVAMFIANLDVDTIDLGVPVLSMHAPFEIVSKLDVYMTYRAIAAFYK